MDRGNRLQHLLAIDLVNVKLFADVSQHRQSQPASQVLPELFQTT